MSIATTILGPRISFTTTGTNEPSAGRFACDIPFDTTNEVNVSGGLVASSAVTVNNSGKLAVGTTGSRVSGIFSSVVSVDFGAISSGVSSLVTVALAGALSSSALVVNFETAGSGGSTGQLLVAPFSSTTPGEVSLVASNISTLAVNARNQNIRVTALNF